MRDPVLDIAIEAPGPYRWRKFRRAWPLIGWLVVTFWVFVNTVNGNKSETFGTDHWTMKTVRIGVGVDPEVRGPPPPQPPFAMETFGVLLGGAAFGGFALFTFYKARRPAGPDASDVRQRRQPRKRDSKREK